MRKREDFRPNDGDYDPACEVLANYYFLKPDNQGAPASADLAQHIQEAVEDWFRQFGKSYGEE